MRQVARPSRHTTGTVHTPMCCMRARAGPRCARGLAAAPEVSALERRTGTAGETRRRLRATTRGTPCSSSCSPRPSSASSRRPTPPRPVPRARLACGSQRAALARIPGGRSGPNLRGLRPPSKAQRALAGPRATGAERGAAPAQRHSAADFAAMFVQDADSVREPPLTPPPPVLIGHVSSLLPY